MLFRHEVSETLGYISYAFGIDGIDRYIRVYRKENPPCEDELLARRRGDPWNEQVKQELIESVRFYHCNSYKFIMNNCLPQRNQIKVQEKIVEKEIVPNSNYKDKYAHIIGHTAALEAAVKTEVNKTYGFGMLLISQLKHIFIQTLYSS